MSRRNENDGNSTDFYDLTKGEDAAREFSCEAAS
jgi:hypothetical protein